MDSLKLLRLDSRATLPTRAHVHDAGLDLYLLEDSEILPLQGAILRTGIAMAVPERHVGLVRDRSSMAKRGLKTAGGVIDSGYRGEIQIVLRNLTQESVHLKSGERIAQLLILPIVTPAVLEVKELDSTSRGEGGFGSTGR